MKLSPLITVALGMLAFAAPQGDPNAAKHAVSNDFTTASGADSGQDLSNVEDKGVLVHAEYEIPANMTPGLAALGEVLSSEWIMVTMAGEATRVGQYHGEKMFNMIQEHGMPTDCELDFNCFWWWKSQIDEVEYIDRRGRLATNAHIELTYPKADIPWHKDEYSKRRMLAKGLIDVLAHVFKTQTEVPENCLNKEVTTNDGKGKIRIYHCQVGEYVSVSASGGKSPVRLQMKLNFNTATRAQDKTYKCGRGDINRRLSEEFNRWVPNLIRNFDPESPVKTVLSHCFDGPPGFCC